MTHPIAKGGMRRHLLHLLSTNVDFSGAFPQPRNVFLSCPGWHGFSSYAVELDSILPDYLRLFILCDGLRPAMLPIGLLAIEPKGFKHQRIVNGEAETLCHGWRHDGASAVEDGTSPRRIKSLPGEGGYH